ncbi:MULTISPECIES: hypothetical protein [unclassified Vibrio]|uniref:hypothetical protein n=1 Tax=unclassified Vibrio TaxID=2614977 RepID=UPI0012678A18|nr:MULTISPECIES: hypothetical protein [unclassified Vibrio]QFT37387.1 hypothetical protein FIU99_13270 [Vibrio sp. THAF64]QGM35289.1 hypothetical protein GGC04_13275 [Vibrio sp. THAF191d]QGN70790.1 hypothetical protein GGC03_13275 [Vibrio sp. THAF191c]
MIYDENTKTLIVSKILYEQIFPAADSKKPLVKLLPVEKQTAASIKALLKDATTQTQLLACLEQKLGCSIHKIIHPNSCIDAETKIKAYTDSTYCQKDILLRLKQVFLHQYQLLRVKDGVKYYDTESIGSNTEWIVAINNLIPEEDDLTRYFNVIPDKSNSGIWGKVCRLIALAKMDQPYYAKTKEITRDLGVTDELKAVQALHKYYYTDKHIMYDDVSCSSQIYTDFNYRMIFSGDCTYEDLKNHVVLESGSYIFDIVGHSVKVDVLKKFDAYSEIKSENISEFFTYDSDPDNYTADEKIQKVNAIWKKIS